MIPFATRRILPLQPLRSSLAKNNFSLANSQFSRFLSSVDPSLTSHQLNNKYESHSNIHPESSDALEDLLVKGFQPGPRNGRVLNAMENFQSASGLFQACLGDIVRFQSGHLGMVCELGSTTVTLANFHSSANIQIGEKVEILSENDIQEYLKNKSLTDNDLSLIDLYCLHYKKLFSPMEEVMFSSKPFPRPSSASLDTFIPYYDFLHPISLGASFVQSAHHGESILDDIQTEKDPLHMKNHFHHLAQCALASNQRVLWVTTAKPHEFEVQKWTEKYGKKLHILPLHEASSITTCLRLLSPLIVAAHAIALSKQKENVSIFFNDLTDLCFDAVHLNGKVVLPRSFLSNVSTLMQCVTDNKIDKQDNGYISVFLSLQDKLSSLQKHPSTQNALVEKQIKMLHANVSNAHVRVDFSNSIIDCLYQNIHSQMTWHSKLVKETVHNMRYKLIELREKLERARLITGLKMHQDFWEVEEKNSLVNSMKLITTMRQDKKVHLTALIDSFITLRAASIVFFPKAFFPSSSFEDYQAALIEFIKAHHLPLYEAVGDLLSDCDLVTEMENGEQTNLVTEVAEERERELAKALDKAILMFSHTHPLTSIDI